MRKHIPSAALLVALGAIGDSLAGIDGAGQADVPVRKVVLFSSGVGYFEHAGTVSGSASTELRFRSSQINDMLKSLVLEDLDGGRVGTVVYPSQDPLSKTLRSFQVDISSNPPLGELLNQLRGAEVSVNALGEEMVGTILGLEQKDKPFGENGSVKVWVLNLISGGTIRAIELADARKIQLNDAALQAELSKALLALSQARDQDKKPVTINFTGQDERRVRIGYVVETPIWKTTYRLIMPDRGEDQAKLQGWAIVENQTESDWSEVLLSLVSGRPISFVQNLYQPLYVPRPVVEPELYASLTPQTYDEGMDLADRETDRFAEGPKEERMRLGAEALRRGGWRGGGEAGALERAKMMMAAPSADMADAYPATAGIPLDAAVSVAALATASDIGELFQYTVAQVSLPRQRSAMIPIVTDDVQAERMSIFNRDVLARRPLNGALLTNTTGKHLLAGPVTVIDDASYAGDAQIENLPPGQHRLLSYAVDLDVHVDATKTRDENMVETGKVVKGVLHLVRKQTFNQDYVIENKADRAKTLLVEHTFRGGWKLVGTPKPFETTDRLYRFKDEVPAGGSSTLTVKEERTLDETIAILPADIGQIERYSRSGEIPPEVRKALARAIELKSVLVDTQREIQQAREHIGDITSEQERIRSNMKTVSESSQYYTRLLAKLNEQETSIERLQGEIERLEEQLDKQRGDLEKYLIDLNVD